MGKRTLLSVVVLALVASSFADDDTTTPTSTNMTVMTTDPSTEMITNSTTAPTEVTTLNSTLAPTPEPTTETTTNATSASSETTEAPTTITDLTSTVAPTEAPTTDSPTSAPASDKWVVRNSTSGVVCILAKFNLLLDVPYYATNQAAMNKTVLLNAIVNVTNAATVDATRSSCYISVATGAIMQQMTLQIKSMKTHNVTVVFGRNVTTDRQYVDRVVFEYDMADTHVFPNATQGNQTMQTAGANPGWPLWNTNAHFVCATGAMSTLPNDDDSTLNVTAHFSDIEVQAFRMSNTTDFDGDSTFCPWDPTPTPTPTPTPAPTPVPSTTPAPVVHGATYQVMAANGSVCLQAQFGISVMVKYQTVAGNIVQADIPNVDNGTVISDESMCSENVSMLVIGQTWIPDWKLYLTFNRSSENKFALVSVALSFNLDNSSVIQNAKNTSQLLSMTTGLNKWNAAVGHSYKCNANDDWNLNVEPFKADVPELHVTVHNVQTQAFMSAVSNGTTPVAFGDAEECSNDYTSDIVPIAVGCALAALVVIVLIAYVIGRRRNRARGYESM